MSIGGKPNSPVLVLLLMLCQLSLPASGQQKVEGEVDALLDQGNFQQASNLLSRLLTRAGPQESERRKLSFELDRIERIRKDYPHSERALFGELRKKVRDLTWDEYQLWIREGRFDSRLIEGQRFFMSASVSNLFFRYPELNDRRIPKENSATHDKALYETCAAIKAAARSSRESYVLPKRFQVTMTVQVQPGTAAKGEQIRAWLPIPREYPFQGGFELLSSSSPVKALDGSKSPIRSLLLERPLSGSKPTEFRIEYAYTTRGVWFDLDPRQARPCDSADPQLKPYLQEALHVQFTPELRRLAREVAGEETNPVIAARKFYDWISENIKYSYAIEYSTIRNISGYCLAKRYGDCGQEALLFISLCRLSGIPARWQSGWSIFPGDKKIHDWTEIYLARYGWVPVDPDTAAYATQYALTLPPEKRREVRDFYFGGLDQYRMIANSDHCQQLSPPKAALRSDNVDFQRAELESRNQNIYFDKYTYDLVAREIKLPREHNIQ